MEDNVLAKKEKVKSKKKRGKTIKVIIWVFAIAVVATGAFLFVPKLLANDESSETTLQRRTSVVAQGDVIQTIGSSAPIESSITKNVKAGIQGEVLEIMVEESEIVDAGTIIMTLDTSSTDTAIEALEKQIDSKQDQIDDKNDSIETKYSQIEDKKDDITSKYEDINDYREDLLEVEDEISDNESSINDLMIYATSSGSIFDLSVSEGDTVNTTKSLATITNTTSYSVEMAFNAAVLDKTIQTVTITQLTNVFEGTIESISGYTYKDEFSNEKVDIIISFDTDTALKDRATVTAKIEADGFTYTCNKRTEPYYDTNDEILSEVSGEILELFISEKQYVTEGELIAVIDGTSIDDKANTLEAQKESIQNQIDNLYDSIESANEDIEQYYEDIADLQDEIIDVEEEIDDILDEIAETKEEYDNAVVTAEYGGIVSGIKVEVGDSTNANTTLFSLISLESPSIVVAIDELDIANVENGMEAEVTIDALGYTEGTPVAAMVTKISPEGNYQNGVTTYDVTVTLTEIVEELKLNMNATATIYIGKSEDTLYIPIEAVTLQDGKSYVYIQGSSSTVTPVANNTTSETNEQTQNAAAGQRRTGNLPDNVNIEDMTEEQKAQMEQRMAERGVSMATNGTTEETVNDISTYYEGASLVEVATGIHNEMYIEILNGLELGDVVILPPLYTSSSNSAGTEKTTGMMMPGITNFGGDIGTGNRQKPTGNFGGGN